MCDQVRDKELLDTRRASEYLGKPEHYLAHCRAYDKGPPYIKVGRNVFYRRKDLDEYREKLTKVMRMSKPMITPRMIGKDAVKKLTGIKTTKMLDSMVESGSFPPPVKYGCLSVWPIEMVEEWLEDIISKTYKQLAKGKK